MTLTEANRRVVTAFADLLYVRKDVATAFERHVAREYIQHNPNILDGREAAIVALRPMFARAEASFSVKRILVDGDLAAIHLHGRSSTQSPGGAVVDLYRLAGGLIVEHWDVLQPMPTASSNPHPMF